jgi:hypothetical protein
LSPAATENTMGASGETARRKGQPDVGRRCAMSLSGTSQLSPDVIEGHEPRRPTWPGPLWLVAGGVAVVLAGALAVVVGQDDRRPDIVDASGSMVVEHHVSQGAYRPHGTQSEDGNSSFSGRIRVELPDRWLVGTARLRLFFVDQGPGYGLGILHSWGEVDATFGTTNCEGPFAWTFYGEPRATGGSMSLRCDDGSLLAATARVYGDARKIADDPYPLFIRLEDGSYVAG